MARRSRLYNSIPYALFLGLVCPGLGHIFWGEWAFGLFVFLVLLITSALVYLSFLVTIPNVVLIPLIVLPLIFYVFSLVDLARSIRTRSDRTTRPQIRGILFLLIALTYQLAAPNSPGNFLIRNRPELFTVKTNQLQPDLSPGDLVKASSLEYSVDLFLIDFPVFHDLPVYFDIVRFRLGDDSKDIGLVIGLPGDNVEMTDGVLIVNGILELPSTELAASLTGEMSLTVVEDNSILVASLSMGRIARTRQIKLAALIGRVERVF